MQIKKKLKQPQTFLLVLIFFLTFILYVVSMSPHAIGYADSDEILTTATLFGVSHPSGYPMATIILGLLFRLLPFISKVIVANGLAALLHSTSICLIYLISLEVFRLIRFKDTNLNLSHYLSAAGGALLASVSALIWMYGSILEVVAFTTLLTGFTTYFAIKWYSQISSLRDGKVWFILTWISVGLGLAHVHTLVLLLPPLLLLLFLSYSSLKQIQWYKSISTWILGILSGIVVFILINATLLFLNSIQADISWYFDQSLAGVAHHILRKDYTGNFVEADINRPGYFDGFSSRYLTTQPTYFKYLIEHFGYIGFGFALGGVIILLKSKSKIKWFLLSLFVFAGMLLAGRLGSYPLDEFGAPQSLFTGVMHRQYVYGEYTFAIFISLGIFAFFTLLKTKFKQDTAVKLLILLLAISVFFTTSYNSTSAYQRHNTFISQYAKHMLDSVKPNSVIICSSDIACYSLLYESYVQNTRPDVTLLTKSSRYQQHFHSNNPKYYQMVFSENPDFYSNLIASNLLEHPVYITTPTDYYIDYIGLNGDPFFLVPHGYLFEVITDPSKASFQSNPNYTISSDLINYTFGSNDHFGQGLKSFFSALHNTMGEIYSQYNQKSLAKQNFELSMTLKPQFTTPQQKISNLPYYNGNPNYLSPTSTSSAALVASASAELQNENFQIAYNLLRKASYLDPLNSDIRISIATMLIQANYHTEAYQQLEQVLLSQPQHDQALNLRNSIKNQVDHSRL